MRRLIVIVLCVGFTASTDPFIFCGITQDPPVTLRVFPDAPGDDHENRNGEYVVVTSRVDSSVFLGGWVLCDLAAHCFSFPVGRVLHARDSLTIYTGSGEADSLRLYWGSGRAVWNNDSDTAILKTAAGVVVVSATYGTPAIQAAPTPPL